MQKRYLELSAQGLIFVGWFLLDVIRTTWGSVGLDFHFYEMAAIFANPLRLEFGVGENAGLLTIPFSILCLALIVAPPLVPARFAAVARLAPLVLMLVCGAYLYYIAQQDTFSAARGANDVTNSLLQLANAISRHAGDLLTRHIGLGAGAWVAGSGALLLAYTAGRKAAHAVQAAQ